MLPLLNVFFLSYDQFLLIYFSKEKLNKDVLEIMEVEI